MEKILSAAAGKAAKLAASVAAGAPAKARIAHTTEGFVSLTYFDPDLGETVSRLFKASRNGYVWELQGDELRQVFDNLSSLGSALICGPGEDLLQVIRREFRALRRRQQQQQRHWA